MSESVAVVTCLAVLPYLPIQAVGRIEDENAFTFSNSPGFYMKNNSLTSLVPLRNQYHCSNSMSSVCITRFPIYILCSNAVYCQCIRWFLLVCEFQFSILLIFFTNTQFRNALWLLIEYTFIQFEFSAYRVWLNRLVRLFLNSFLTLQV